MSIRITLSALAIPLLLSACAAPIPPLGSTTSARPDPYARLRGHDAYGLVVALQSPDVTPDMRSTERCARRDESCELLMGESARYQYATVAIGGALSIERMVVLKGQAHVGDIVRFTMPIDRTLVPMSVELGARADKRKTSGCDWIDGTPETKTGGVVCGRWSYRDAR